MLLGEKQVETALLQISPDQWKILLELYAGKTTESIGYSLIKNYINWIEKEPTLDIKCYALNEEWRTDGTFVIIVVNGGNRKDVFFNTLSQDLDHLTELLLRITDNPQNYCLFAYNKRVSPATEAFERKFEHDTFGCVETIWYHLSREIVDTFTIEPPAGIELRSLCFSDASTVFEHWPHRSVGSVKYIERLINHNISIGAYTKEGELVAWCLRLPMGCLGNLQVLDSHKRLGMGSLMVRCLAKQIVALNDEVLAPVVITNGPSRGLMEKLGFQPIDIVYWKSPRPTS